MFTYGTKPDRPNWVYSDYFNEWINIDFFHRFYIEKAYSSDIWTVYGEKEDACIAISQHPSEKEAQDWLRNFINQ